MSDWELFKRLEQLEKLVASLIALLKPHKKKYPKTHAIKVQQK